MQLLGFSILLLTSTDIFGQMLRIDREVCKYYPQDAVFKAGKVKIYHILRNDGVDGYEIWLPTVNQQFTIYKEIPLKKNDEIFIDACGCVQIGGSGKTWKRYVNPSGPNSDKLYHGLIWVENPAAYRLPVSGANKNMVRIADVINAQNRGVRIKILSDSHLILGYEDDNYADNGYWGHDDGTGDQCKSSGGAIVRITIKHK